MWVRSTSAFAIAFCLTGGGYAPAAGAAQTQPDVAQVRAATDATARDPELDVAIEHADALAREDRYAEVISSLHPWAAHGVPTVDFRLAYAHFRRAIDGHPPEAVDKDGLDTAVVFAERAAGQGEGRAMNLLYVIHSDGLGRPTDIDAAMVWLKRAVAAGDVGARINYASMLYEGRPWLARDRAHACRMFTELAEIEGAGAVSMYYLGWATLRGECGLDRNPGRAAEWIGRAAEGGVRDAARDYARLLESGTGVEVDRGRAMDWYARAAERGDGYSLWRVGRAFAEGEGRAVDAERAVEHFQRAIDSGNSEALVSMAVMHATGAGVVRDLPKAVAFYRRAADAGQPHAYRGLALMALQGEGMAVDVIQAAVLYRQALALGNAPEPPLQHAIDSALDDAARAEVDRRFDAWRTRAGGANKDGGG